jgi:MSHA pilin protein MshC
MGGSGLPCFLRADFTFLLRLQFVSIPFLKGLRQMRLGFGQINAIRKEAGHRFGAQAGRRDSRLGEHQCGFTLVELIMAMVIAGILAVVATPLFFDTDIFRSKGFADQVQATLRFAQKAAIAQRRNVCVAVTSGTITLTIASSSGAASVCDTPLIFSEGGNSITSPSAAITISALPVPVPVNFGFEALGKPFDTVGNASTARKSFTVSGAPNTIFVEAETGYVHSP